MSMTEEWRDVPGYEGLYCVSDQGRVLSVRRGHTLKPRKAAKGYVGVVLYKNGRPASHWIHRLVALAFIPNPENKPEVNHKDGYKWNDRASNLEWVTRSENQRHRYNVLQKRRTSGRPVRCRETGKVYPTATAAATDLNIHRSAVTRCCLGVRNSTNKLHFEFTEV